MGNTSLTIKDGNGSTQTLSAYSSPQGFIVEHAVTASVSASFSSPVAITASSFAPVPVTSSQARPVYVTGNVSITQPVNVDVVVGDNISVTSSITSPLYVSSSFNSPILVTGTIALQSNSVTISGTPTITGSVGITGTPTITGSVGLTGTPTITGSVGLTGTPTITGSVGLTGTPIITGSVGITGTPTITGSVGITGTPVITGTVGVNTSVANPLYTQLGNISSYGYPAGSALITKITGNLENDRFWITGNVDIGVMRTPIPDGLALVVKVTGSSDQNLTYITGNVDVGASKVSYPGGNALVVKVTSSNQDTYSVQISDIAKYSFSGGNALITKLTGTGTNSSDRIWVTGSVTSTGGSTVVDGLKVELSGSNVKQINASSTNTYLQASIAAVATSSNLTVFAPPNWGGPVPSGDPKVFIFDWTTAESGTFCAASASINRKSLTIFNDSEYSAYLIIGDPWGASQTNGLALYSTSSKPNMYSFVLYPSGTYFAEPHNVNLKHGMFLVSGTISSETRIFSTETY